MTDLDELSRLIRADAQSRGQTISRLGYFCAPFRPDSGPLSDRVIKVYRGMGDVAALDRLHRCHDDYVDALLAGGVPAADVERLARELGVRADLPAVAGDRVPLRRAGGRARSGDRAGSSARR